MCLAVLGCAWCPIFKSSQIHVVTYILKKTAFMPSKVFSDKISSEIECLRVSRNQRYFSLPTVEGVGIRQLGQSLYP